MKSMNTNKALVLGLASLISFSSAVQAVRFVPSMSSVKNIAVAPVSYPWWALKASYRGGKRATNNIVSLIACYLAPSKEARLLNQAKRCLSYPINSAKQIEKLPQAYEKISRAFDLIVDRFANKDESCEATTLALNSYCKAASSNVTASIEEQDNIKKSLSVVEFFNDTRDAFEKSRRMPYAQSFLRRAASKASSLIPSWPFRKKAAEVAETAIAIA